MPTYFNPRRVDIDPGGGGGGLVAAAVVVVAAGAGLIWLARELARIWVELAIIAGGTTVVMGAWLVWMAVHFRRGSLPVNAAAKASAIAAARAVPAPVTAGEVHHHYGEQHTHHHQELHIHQAPPVAEPRPAIAARK